MSEDCAVIDLTHHFLIAMPGLDDELFNKSVVYICEHSEKGALGLVINKPSNIPLAELFTKIDLKLARPDMANAPVFQGGPVQTERGFVLHAPMGLGGEAVYSSTIVIILCYHAFNGFHIFLWLMSSYNLMSQFKHFWFHLIISFFCLNH